MLEAQSNQRSDYHQQVDIDDLLDDPELERLHAERVYALQKEAERRMVLQQKGHGEYQEVEEGQFLQVLSFATPPPPQCMTSSYSKGAFLIILS